MTTEPLELFSSISELDNFDHTSYGSLESKINELCKYICLCDNHSHFFILDEYLDKKNCIYKQDYFEDYWLSFLYTAYHLKYSKVSINAVDLAYSYKIDNILSPEKIQWITLDKIDLSNNYILENKRKKRLYNGETTKWKSSLEKQLEKPYLKRLFQMNQGTIPFFPYKLTYLVVFVCNQEMGIGGNTIKMDKYNSFYDNLLNHIDEYITDEAENLLIKYKAEKIFNPWLINSYSALLQTQNRQSYYPFIGWSSVLSLYHYSMPCQICDFMIDVLCQCLTMDYEIRHSSSEEQINFFKENFTDCMKHFESFSQLNFHLKQLHFFDLYKKLGSLDKIIQESLRQLNACPKDAYTCHTVDEIKEKSRLRIQNLYSKIQGYAQKTFLDDIHHEKVNKSKELQVSYKVKTDCSILFQ